MAHAAAAPRSGLPLGGMAAPLQLSHASSGSLSYTFVDEEVLLGFKIWVAELELLVRRGWPLGLDLHWPLAPPLLLCVGGNLRHQHPGCEAALHLALAVPMPPLQIGIVRPLSCSCLPALPARLPAQRPPDKCLSFSLSIGWQCPGPHPPRSGAVLPAAAEAGGDLGPQQPAGGEGVPAAV